MTTDTNTDTKTTIYIVTSGEYSDYGIRAIFSSKEKAETFIVYGTKIGMFSYSKPEIEEHTLDPYSEQIEKKLYPFITLFDENYNVIQTSLDTYPDIERDRYPRLERFTTRINTHYRFYTLSKNEETAKKSAVDYFRSLRSIDIKNL